VQLLRSEFGDGDTIVVDAAPDGRLAFKRAAVAAV
jgi:hypothetical protein